ncbi:hypothetical protein ACS0TY_036278 [Phlomoides rotata]
MSSETEPLNNQKLTSHHHSTTAFRWTLRRGRPRLPTARLGGKKRRRGFFILRLCKKAKLRWLRLKYLSILNKLKKHYESFAKEMAEGRGAMESFQQRMILEASFVVPTMGLTFAGL